MRLADYLAPTSVDEAVEVLGARAATVEAPPPQHCAKTGSGARRPEARSARVRTFVFILIMFRFDFDYRP